MTDLSKNRAQAERLSYTHAVSSAAGEVAGLLKAAPAVIRGMTTHLSRATGKMIRARALLACAIGSDGKITYDAVKAAAAVELMHLATLVHDDIIDDADKRRGIDTLHRKFGQKYAVLCGDFLFCTALELASTVGVLEHRREPADRVFPRYLTEVCLGEIRQNRNSQNLALTEREYFKIIRGKTAALFEASFYAGFLFSDAPDTAREIYIQIGGNIGLIFQLSDDCADYTSTRRASKKPVLSDYNRGVITLPLIYAMKSDKTLRERAKAGMQAEELKAAVMAAGGLDAAHKKIDDLYHKTLRMTQTLEAGEKQELLIELLQKSAGKAPEAKNR